MKAKHAAKRPKITISLWLFIAIIAVLVLMIVGITIYSVQKDLKNNDNTATTASVTTVTETTVEAKQETEQTTQNVEEETTEELQTENTTAEPTTDAIVVSGAESADKSLNFTGDFYPYKAFDNIGKRDASIKEVFGSMYGGEGLSFDENGLFSDNITQSEYNYGAYTVTDGVINMTYSNDKNKTAEVISYNGNVPSEIKIDYVGYDVYFKVGSAE